MTLRVGIRDLLYFDFDKAASIWSQLEDGLLEQVTVSDDLGKDRSAGTKFGIPGIAEANLGVEYLQKRSVVQTRTLHHDLLSRIEDRLTAGKFVADLTDAAQGFESPLVARQAIGHRPYLKVEGSSVIEDYRRILGIAERFNEIMSFISRSAQENLKKTSAFVELQRLIEEQERSLTAVKDRNEKSKRRAQLAEMRGAIEKMLESQLTKVDEWVIKGMRLMIDTFMANRINFRIYPSPGCPSFQVLCNLKRECFVDTDVEHLLYGYGNRPNVPLAVFGLITSLPPSTPPDFDPLTEFAENPELQESAAVEQGFRGAFAGVEGMEAMMRFSRYPNVTVHPIAVYRSLRTSE